MNQDEKNFLEYAEKQVSNILQLIEEKGKIYDQPGTTFGHNYHVIGDMLDLPSRVIIMASALKHMWALGRWAHNPTQVPDSRERMRDVIVFMLMLMFMERRISDEDIFVGTG